MGVELFTLLLIGFILIAALIAVETRDLLSSVIALGAAGFGLSVVNLLLGAPDLAITQVVVEVVALVILVRVIVTRRDESSVVPRDALRTAVVLLGCGLLLAAMFFAVGGVSSEGTIPAFGQPLLAGNSDAQIPPGVAKDYLADASEKTGAVNAVMAILLDFRAYDTLGEATVIFAAIVGAYAILRQSRRRRQENSS